MTVIMAAIATAAAPTLDFLGFCGLPAKSLALPHWGQDERYASYLLPQPGQSTQRSVN
jgi:hypothetical protein